MADNDQPQEPLTQDETAALQSWSSIGSPGAAPTTPYIPTDEQRSRFQSIRQLRTITVDWNFDLDAYHKFKYGHQAHEQEDKWNIYLEDNILHFHRSWTGNELFRFTLVKNPEMHIGPNKELMCYKYYKVSSFEVEQDPEVYKATDEQEIKNTILQVMRVLLGVQPAEIAEKQSPPTSNEARPERTANPTEIADAVKGFLDYMNAVKDISTGAKGLTPKFVIDEAPDHVQEITDGLVYLILDSRDSTPFRKSPLGTNLIHPKSARAIAIRTHSQNPDNEKAPYLQPFWVEIPHGTKPAATVDENYERRLEPITKGHYSGLDHRMVNERFNNTIIDAFTPQSKYERSFWLPTKKFATPSVVMFAYLKEDKQPDGWQNTKDRTPMIWFAKDFKSGALVGSAFSLVATLYPDFKGEDLKPMKTFVEKPKAFETWRNNMDNAANAYFNSEMIDKEVARALFVSLPSLIPPEYQKWVIEYFDDFWKFLRAHFLDGEQPLTDQKES